MEQGRGGCAGYRQRDGESARLETSLPAWEHSHSHLLTLEMTLLQDLEQCLDGNDPGPSTQAAILLGVGMVSAPTVRSQRDRTHHLKHPGFPVQPETASPGRGSVRRSSLTSFVVDPWDPMAFGLTVQYSTVDWTVSAVRLILRAVVRHA